MIIEPSSLDELKEILTSANTGGKKITGIHLDRLNRVVAHAPADMTVTVEAGIALARLQAELARERQWLPVDPPNPEHLTIGALLATNASGPRRFGHGPIRDHLIGIKVVLADGRIIKSGGRVVKNVAGYDLAKLFVGNHGSLGVIVEASFKLRPLPEAEQFVQAPCERWEYCDRMIDAVLESELTPVVLDLHNAPSRGTPHGSVGALVLGIAGSPEEVAWQRARANELGWQETATLDYEKDFWNDAPRPHCISVLPSRVVETIRGLGEVPFVARAGNGVIYYRGGPQPAKDELPVKLMRRVKEAFDPNHVLPDLPR